jgi:transposase
MGLIMFISRNTSRHKSGKVYQSILLRESYREGKIVKKRTIANLSHCNENQISALEAALKNKNTSSLPVNNEFKVLQGRSVGSVYALHSVAKELGIVEALGSSFHAKLTLWLIIARILEQGSRLSATRLDSQYDIASIIGLERGFDENNLYDCLHWLDKNQNEIEDSLFSRKKHAKKLFWYDVTSSYFEGVNNELSAFGYNRDKKSGKRIIVVGLLCQENGDPLSIEAFKGNTQDTQTFQSQLDKLKNRFKCESVTLICDRGLIRDKQKNLLKEYGYHYISALPMPQVLSLLNEKLLYVEDFTAELKCFSHQGLRYIYRRNPKRALDAQDQRQERLESLKRKVDSENMYLHEHPKASIEVSEKKIKSFLKTLCLLDWVSAQIVDKKHILCIDEEQLKKKSEMDGCYIWTTDLSEQEMSTKEIYERYKDLKYIEDDFRSFKTSFLEVRPFYVRSEMSTRGHLLIVMLSHMILRKLREKWAHFNKTTAEAIGELSLLCRNTIEFSDGQKIQCIPTPNEGLGKLLEALDITMPKSLEEIKVPVVTRHKVRNSASL